MFGIRPGELAPIRAVADALHPGNDRGMMGDWGILYLVCGALAGRGPSWRATIAASFPDSPHLAVEQYLNETEGKHTGRSVAFTFSESIIGWLGDPVIRTLAANRLDALLRARAKPIDARVASAMIEYVTLATALNSLGRQDAGEFGVVQGWARAHPGSWEILFFAAGLILGSNAKFPLPALRNALLSLTPSTAVEIRGLLNTYDGIGRR